MSETIGSFNNDVLPEGQTDFADLLRDAVAARGLGLERIRARLDHAGTPVSVATLSYWCSGRSQPERRTSLAALPHLDAILDLPAGTLAQSLACPRDRGRRRDVARLESVWPEVTTREVLDQLDTAGDGDLERLSVHDLITVGPDRREQGMYVREVVRARRDGIDRRVVLHCVEDGTAGPTQLITGNGCRAGRCVTGPDGTFGAELMFLEPLARGETAVLEYLVATTPPRPLETCYARRFRVPVREYVLQVRFDGSALPESCETVGDDGPPRPLDLAPDHSVQRVEIDCPTGQRGVRWHWPVGGSS
ncbi:hypothetical protein KUV85_02860 [Nocardioides panacisoli]|uniref:hypothetical protein n=1 Tax=Nocardioides panacisoli TaxID=627624 RepID=UPI001C624FFF|nr:hypothetical protein [Nocardioides panacisoli]QYJ04637.1 hypothetical protein KUV85_02860 [Nocardioides panacisoli]